MEGEKITLSEISTELENLKNKLSEREKNLFLPLIIRNNFKKLEESGDINVAWFNAQVKQFYRNCFDYLQKWSTYFETIKLLHWIDLKKECSWAEVQDSFQSFLGTFGNITIDENMLFDEVTCLKNYVTEEKIVQWSQEHTNTDLRWTEIFCHFKKNNVPFENILKIVEFSLSLPATNAPTERIFSMINKFWTDEKSQFAVDTIKAILTVKRNFCCSCEDFYDKIKSDKELLKQVHRSEKYL